VRGRSSEQGADLVSGDDEVRNGDVSEERWSEIGRRDSGTGSLTGPDSGGRSLSPKRLDEHVRNSIAIGDPKCST
jgi:hypothetical protein